VDDIFTLGIKALRMKKRREKRRSRVRGDIEKVNKNVEKVK
jgi:hypothetical protein